jgi:hypothetical protein
LVSIHPIVSIFLHVSMTNYFLARALRPHARYDMRERLPPVSQDRGWRMPSSLTVARNLAEIRVWVGTHQNQHLKR